MNYSMEWHPAQAEAVYSIILASIAFMIYYFAGKSEKMLAYFIRQLGEQRGQARFILVRRLLGATFFGLIPAVVLMGTQPYSMADYGWDFRFTAFDVYWTLGLASVIVALTFISAKKPSSLAIYPEIRQAVWKPALLIQSNGSWMLFLLAYELMFRGILLFSCARGDGRLASHCH
ncbi:MAG: hypothetical protein IPL65_21085 [Lewinellaceae bacterium]|nr:hypothetical protein [Lewinellaceae bacterium]